MSLSMTTEHRMDAIDCFALNDSIDTEKVEKKNEETTMSMYLTIESKVASLTQIIETEYDFASVLLLPFD